MICLFRVVVLVKELVESDNVGALNFVAGDEVDDSARLASTVDSDVEEDGVKDSAKESLMDIGDSNDTGGGEVKELEELVFFLVKS